MTYHIIQTSPFRTYYSFDKSKAETFARIFKAEVKTANRLPDTYHLTQLP